MCTVTGLMPVRLSTVEQVISPYSNIANITTMLPTTPESLACENVALLYLFVFSTHSYVRSISHRSTYSKDFNTVVAQLGWLHLIIFYIFVIVCTVNCYD